MCCYDNGYRLSTFAACKTFTAPRSLPDMHPPTHCSRFPKENPTTITAIDAPKKYTDCRHKYEIEPSRGAGPSCGIRAGVCITAVPHSWRRER